MADEELLPSGNVKVTDDDNFKKFFNVDVSNLTLPTPAATSDNALEICIISFLNNIIKLILAGALTALLPIKSFFTIILSILAYRKILASIDVKRKIKELGSIVKKFHIPKLSNPFGGSTTDSRTEKRNSISTKACSAAKAVYDTAATELENNVNKLKDQFRLHLALPDCVITSLKLDKPIKLPKFGVGDEGSMEKSAFKRLNKVENRIQQLLNLQKSLEAQIQTINNTFPLISKVQDLINLKVKVQ